MEEDYKFNNVDELYKRILPALRSKVEELKRSKISYITERDIWSYLSSNVWRKKKDLEFYEIIDSILNVSVIELNNYLTNNIKSQKSFKNDDSIL